MDKFLIDINLPKKIKHFNQPNFLHVRDLSNTMSDTEIWNYARENNLIIVSKDTDFEKRMLFHNPPPKVISIKIGNCSLKDFHEIFSKYWDEAEHFIQSNRMVLVYNNKIEAIN